MELDEISVWFARPEMASADEFLQFNRVLDETERSRAGRFHFSEDRRAYVCAHALARCALEQISGVPARALRFRLGAYGKPDVSGFRDENRPRFNLSHTRGLVACAVARNRDLGVDVEQVSPDVDIDALAHQVFAADEVAYLQCLERHARRHAFFGIWTVKEAYIKAVGKGLSIPLQSFSVSLAERSLAIGDELHCDPDAGGSEDWNVLVSQPLPNHALSVVVRTGAAGAVRYKLREIEPEALSAMCCAQEAVFRPKTNEASREVLSL